MARGGRISTAWALGVLGSCLIVACHGADPAHVRSRPINIVLIVIDTLRADHLGCYGYWRDTSPAIDAFAAGATRYSRALSAAPWTVPSHGALFTGKPPFQHGAHTFPVDRPSTNVNPLPLDQLTLAEALRERGYRTAAFVSNVAFLAKHWQLNQGFEEYVVERLYADELNRMIFSWLDRQAHTEPFFLFVNYIDTHQPYNTRPRPELVELPEEAEPHALRDELARRVMPAKDPVPSDLIEKVIAQYDTSIGNVDEQIGALLERLHSAGLDDRTLIVITSDHGEYFGEHRLVGHSKDVYQPALVVPLIIRAPGQTTGNVVDVPVVSNDVPHLISQALSEPLRGELAALFPDAPGNHLVLVENYYTRSKDLFHPDWGWRFNRVRRAVFDWPYKYIDSSDGRHELYQLELDPGESDDLIDREPGIVARLAEELREFDARRRTGQLELNLAPVDEELHRKLEALGYVGS